jgi:hypothetical protein
MKKQNSSNPTAHMRPTGQIVEWRKTTTVEASLKMGHPPASEK